MNFAYTEQMMAMMGALNLQILFLLYGAAISSSFFSALAIFFAEWLPFLLIAFVIAYKFFVDESEKIFWSLLSLFLSPFVAVFIAEVCKFVAPSPRPFADGLGIMPLISVSDPMGSFPSAHAAFFGALGVAIFFEHPQIGRWFLCAALLIGISRIAIGVHFPIDIITGLFLGVLAGILINMFQRMLIMLQSKK